MELMSREASRELPSRFMGRSPQRSTALGDAQNSTKKKSRRSLRSLAEIEPTQVDVVHRPERVPLGGEDVERHDRAGDEPEGVDVDRAALGAVDPPEIDRQAAVDEHEDVIIAREIEDLAAPRAEGRMLLEREG